MNESSALSFPHGQQFSFRQRWEPDPEPLLFFNEQDRYTTL